MKKSTTEPFDILALCPETDTLMQYAWIDFIRFGINNQDMLGQFAAETGYTPPRTPLERMIDESAGVTGEMAKRYIRWATENYWGVSTPDAEEGK